MASSKHILSLIVFFSVSTCTCRSVYELWGQGNNIEDLKQCVLKYPAKKMVWYLDVFKFVLQTSKQINLYSDKLNAHNYIDDSVHN